MNYCCCGAISKAGLTLNDLCDTICMTHNRLSDFHWAYTFIQVVHTEIIKVVRTEYSDFKTLSKMSQEQAAETVIITLISEKNNSKKKRQKRKVGIKPWLKRRKILVFYKTLLTELCLKEEYNYKSYLRMTLKTLKKYFN